MARKNRRRASPWVGIWLRSLREETEVTREQVASTLNRDESWISRIETGVSAIRADDLPAVLAAYDVSPAQFARKAASIQIPRAAA